MYSRGSIVTLPYLTAAGSHVTRMGQSSHYSDREWDSLSDRLSVPAVPLSNTRFIYLFFIIGRGCWDAHAVRARSGNCFRSRKKRLTKLDHYRDVPAFCLQCLVQQAAVGIDNK